MNLFDISGKVALITGSSRGLGLAYAKGFLEAGAVVVMNGTNADTLSKAVDDLKAVGYNAHGYAFDVSDEKAVKENIEKIEKEVGAIEILINNAGIHRRHMLLDMPLEDWEKVINTNLTSTFIVAKEVARRMIDRKKGGKIINVSSLNTEMARPNIGNYCASKGGIKMLTKSMATEWGKYGINVNALGPGYIETDLTKPLIEDADFNKWVCSEVPLGRWGKPEDLVGAAIFLASSASDYVHGFSLYVDGGWQACL